MPGIVSYLKKIPKEVIYILKCFFITRFFLTIIGVVAVGLHPQRQFFSQYKILNVWGLWDSSWYLNIAQFGYSNHLNILKQANYGFFPLYPLFIKIFSFIFQDYAISALIVSNLFLILAAIFLYKLSRLDCNEKTSLRTIKYLFLFPSAFILSAALSESLFLFLIVVCFYCAKKQNWFLSGFFGMLLTLTKPFGIIILVPVVYEFFMANKGKWRLSYLHVIKDACFISLIPMGLALFAIYTYFLTGDILAYPHIKATAIGWGDHLESPMRIILSSLASGKIGYFWGAVASIIIIFILLFFYKKIDFSYFLAGLLMAIFCISYTGILTGSLRYYTAMFPIYMIFGKITENKKLDIFLSVVFVILQIVLMGLWTIQSGIII